MFSLQIHTIYKYIHELFANGKRNLIGSSKWHGGIVWELVLDMGKWGNGECRGGMEPIVVIHVIAMMVIERD